VVAMLCLFVILLLGAMLVRLAVAERGQQRVDERRWQAEWLAESGLERAWAKLAADRDYAGETWALAPEDLGGPWGGRVRIEVERIPDHPDRRRIKAKADYPADATLRARRSKQLTIELGPEIKGEH